MTADLVQILGPRGQPLEPSVAKFDSSTHQIFGAVADEVGGARPNPRRYDWRIYHEMFEKHPIVFAAINKLQKVATNTGYEFIPRSVTDEISDAETNIAREFFASLPDFKEQLRVVYLHLLIYGDAFMYIVPNRKRQPARLKTLAPWTVNIKARTNGTVESYYQKDPTDPRSEGLRYKPHEIIHFRMPNPKDQLYGLSLLEPLKSVVLTDMLAEKFNRSFFKNGASTGTVFVFNGATEDTLKRMRRWIQEKYVGADNAHLPFVIDGDVRIERSVASHQDMGFLEGREAIKAQILAVLDVPPAKIGYMESANRSNSKEQDKSFRSESIMPLQYIVESALSDQLLRNTLGLRHTLFKHVEADVRDRQEQAELWTRYVQNGIMTINEVRGALGMMPIEGGDIAFVMAPTGAVPVVDLELYFKIPQINSEQVPTALHDGHAHSQGRDPKDGAGGFVGSRPEGRTTRVNLEAPSTGKSLAASPPTLQMARDLLKQVRPDQPEINRNVVRHAWSYLVDAYEDTNNPQIEFLAKSLRKAVESDDTLLFTTYVERTSASLMTMGGGA